MVAVAGERITLYFLVAVAALILGGCAVQVRPHDLVGEWQMTDEAIQRLSLMQVRPNFRLNDDGSLKAENVPTTAFQDSTPWRSLYTGTGTWTAPAPRRTQGFSSVVLDFKRTDTNEATGLIMHVDKDSHGIYIFSWLDEEGGERLIYRRRGNSP